jgi:hypothetical protein
MRHVPRAKDDAVIGKKDSQALLHFALRLQLPSLVREGRRQLEKNALKHASQPKDAAVVDKKGRQSLRRFAARFGVPSLVGEGRRQFDKQVSEHAQSQSKGHSPESASIASAEISRPDSPGLRWETEPLAGAPPLRGLRLDMVDKYAGGQGELSSYTTTTGDAILGKIPMLEEFPENIDDLFWELIGFARAALIGPCDNIVRAHGIAKVPRPRDTEYALIEDEVPGQTGAETLTGLGQRLRDGEHAQFWGALQVMADDLLQGLEHLALAGVVHDDLKGENFLVNLYTAVSVLIDLGLWGEPGTPARPGFIHPDMAPERRNPPYTRTEKSDVYALGTLLRRAAALAASIPPAEEDSASVQAQADWAEFLGELTAEDPAQRPTAAGARKLNFIARRAVPEETGREVLRETVQMLDSISQQNKGKGKSAAAPVAGIAAV